MIVVVKQEGHSDFHVGDRLDVEPWCSPEGSAYQVLRRFKGYVRTPVIDAISLRCLVSDKWEPCRALIYKSFVEEVPWGVLEAERASY